MEKDIEPILNYRIGKPEIDIVVSWASQKPENREELFLLAFRDKSRTASNALWCVTHFDTSCSEWLQFKQDFLINELLKESNTSRKRMLLQLLREQEYPAEELRVDFLDYCLSKINAESEAYAIRCFSLYLAYKMCRHFPELMSELKERLALLSRDPLSPGMKCAVRKVSDQIIRVEKI